VVGKEMAPVLLILILVVVKRLLKRKKPQGLSGKINETRRTTTLSNILVSF